VRDHGATHYGSQRSCQEARGSVRAELVADGMRV
jgi:hypothetical protein